ncbi:hypothetical protein TFLX_04261 [Thermoflexales bacterium]|nr:hypothetical protein TFLX_04261 [Thermoflexales bacterium]
MRNNSDGTRTVRPIAEVMALMCPKCARLNESRHSKDDELAYGTLFIPVSLEQKAAVETGYAETRKVQCHQYGHEVTVHLQAQ